MAPAGPPTPSAPPSAPPAPRAPAPGPSSARAPAPAASRPPGPTAPTAPTPPSPAPEPTPVPGAATRPARRPLHGDPPLRRVLRTLRTVLGSSAARGVADATATAEQVQQPVTTGRQIVVTSIRGGAGKTTVAALLSRTFVHYRHDPVLAMEADSALGTLPTRLGATSVRWTCADVAGLVTPSMRLTDITGYLVALDDRGWLLPGSRGDIGAPVDIPTYRTVVMALRRFFAVTVVDCETLPGEVARTALVTAHACVLVAPATVEGVASTATVLAWMSSLPKQVLRGTVVALTCSAPDQVLDVRRAERELREAGVEVVVIPYDRHLAAGGVISAPLLGAETQVAATRLAGIALDRAVGRGAGGEPAGRRTPVEQRGQARTEDRRP
ncbi:hypothetical protein AB0399_14730 [Streptomyces sp. NPDC088194]|uniref:hypothetical protein n=1 Tax=Streptomyces sp. NPDC088194 TaxID=3154931 RepID=UPI003450D206